MIVVDTSVWIFAIRGIERPTTARLHAAAAKADILVGDVVLHEVLRGARDDRHAALLEATLRRYPIGSMMDGRLAAVAASNYRRMRARGVTVKGLADLIIATFCIEHGHQLLHDDRDFAPMVEHLGLHLG